MDSSDVGRAMNRALQVGPTAALLVPEAELVALILTAREIAFKVDPCGLPNEQRPLLDDLDKTSEPFADMLDLPFSESTDRRKAVQSATSHVRDWLDAGCITLPPVDHIRALIG